MAASIRSFPSIRLAAIWESLPDSIIRDPALGLTFAGLHHRWLGAMVIGFGLAVSLERLLKHIRATRLTQSD
jgi:hypothetical protein